MKKVLYLVCSLLGFGVNDIFACSCLGTIYQTAFYESRVVAYGNVHTITETQDEGVQEGLFRPVTVFKGEVSKNFKVRNRRACSLKLESGEYLIFSRDGENSTVTMCSSSLKLKEKYKEGFLKLMRKLQKDPPEGPPKDRNQAVGDQSCIIFGSNEYLVCEGDKANIGASVEKMRNRSRKQPMDKLPKANRDGGPKSGPIPE